jgi:GNAT superfamily N-acetyltransferase
MSNQKILEINENDIYFKLLSSDDLPHLKKFKCGNQSMEDFLSHDSYYYHLTREASTSLVFFNGELIAYYTIKHTPLKIFDKDQMDISLDIARLAVSKNYQSKGVGTFIVDKIIKTAIEVNKRYIIVDSLYEKWEWYKNNFGFDYLIEDDVLNERIVVSMIIDTYDQELIDKFFDE